MKELVRLSLENGTYLTCLRILETSVEILLSMIPLLNQEHTVANDTTLFEATVAHEA